VPGTTSGSRTAATASSTTINTATGPSRTARADCAGRASAGAALLGGVARPGPRGSRVIHPLTSTSLNDLIQGMVRPGELKRSNHVTPPSPQRRSGSAVDPHRLIFLARLNPGLHPQRRWAQEASHSEPVALVASPPSSHRRRPVRISDMGSGPFRRNDGRGEPFFLHAVSNQSVDSSAALPGLSRASRSPRRRAAPRRSKRDRRQKARRRTARECAAAPRSPRKPRG
jgi:hypothetical protein